MRLRSNTNCSPFYGTLVSRSTLKTGVVSSSFVAALFAVLAGRAAHAEELDVCELRCTELDTCSTRGHVTAIDTGAATFVFSPEPGSKPVVTDVSRLPYLANCSGPSFPRAARADVNATPAPGRVPVHVVSTGGKRDVSIHWAERSASSPGGTIRESICETPCDAFVAPGNILVTVPGMLDGVSKWFAITGPDARIVFTPNSLARDIGTIGLPTGFVGAFFSALLLSSFSNGKSHQAVGPTQAFLAGSGIVFVGSIVALALTSVSKFDFAVVPSPSGFFGAFGARF